MTVLHRYLLGAYLRVFALVSGAALGLGLLFRGFEEMGDMAETSAGAGTLLRYLLLVAPGYLVQAFPLGVLIGTLVVLALASRHGELVAVQSLGGSLRRATVVFLAAGLLTTGTEYFFAERVVPPTARLAERVKETEIKGKPSALTSVGKSLWMRAEGGELVRFTVAPEGEIFDISIFSFSATGALAQRMEARQGLWNGSAWILAGVRIHSFAGEGPRARKVDLMEFSGLEGPGRIAGSRLRPEQMNRRELAGYVARLEQAGFRSERFRVSMASKVAHPFMNLAMALIATGLALRFRRGGGMRAAGLSVFVVLLYWGGQSMALSLGYSGRIAPQAAVWAVPCVFTLLGGLLWARSENG